VDPLTLFALANGAVSAVKAGCKLYKDIKGAAGEVKDILKDLDQQFNKQYEGKPVPPEARKQLQQEKARVVELSKKDPGDIYAEIGEQLSIYFENQAKCIAVWEEEERRSKEVYTGDASVGKRALQRVLMTKKLEHMDAELRELLVYHSPPELGGLYTDVQRMMEKIGKEQKVAIAQKMREDAKLAKQRRRKLAKWWSQACTGFVILLLCSFAGIMFALLVEDRIQKYPHLGTGIIPRSEFVERVDNWPSRYVGR
jgi:hypothetical protein